MDWRFKSFIKEIPIEAPWSARAPPSGMGKPSNRGNAATSTQKARRLFLDIVVRAVFTSEPRTSRSSTF